METDNSNSAAARAPDYLQDQNFLNMSSVLIASQYVQDILTNMEWQIRIKELERLILPTAISFGSSESKYVMEYKFMH